MQTLGAFQVKTHFSSLLEQVEQGEQIIITKHGHPVAKLIPINRNTQELASKAIQHLKEFAKTNKLGNLNWKSLRDDGRR
ncbi:MAG: type II toxin-antitoxin system Phd/YefM family antitoxin [Gammaproteobacteria bacterium]|nr:type II toxin-antitoxin system Phd/YefM family antitoxin [Gammaproteobacteria bacterium]